MSQEPSAVENLFLSSSPTHPTHPDRSQSQSRSPSQTQSQYQSQPQSPSNRPSYSPAATQRTEEQSSHDNIVSSIDHSEPALPAETLNPYQQPIPRRSSQRKKKSVLFESGSGTSMPSRPQDWVQGDENEDDSSRVNERTSMLDSSASVPGDYLSITGASSSARSSGIQSSKDIHNHLQKKKARRRGRSRGNGSEDESERESSSIKNIFMRMHERYGSLDLDNKGSVARDHLALERTYLAWLRTSLSFASIGIAVTQLFRLNTTLGNVANLTKVGKPLGACFIGIAIAILFVGFHRYFQGQHYLLRNKFPASRGSILFVSGMAFGLISGSLIVILIVGGKKL